MKTLQKHGAVHLEAIKIASSYLTVKEDPSCLFFTSDQLEVIHDCNSVRELFMKHLRGCWQWDDISFLKAIVQSLDYDISYHCQELFDIYEKNMYIRMKLHEIHDCCKLKELCLPDGYNRMVAMVRSKIFSQITLEEYRELVAFVDHHCKVEPYAITPSLKVQAPLQVLLDSITRSFEFMYIGLGIDIC